MGRVAAIAVDAAEWDFVEELIEAGELPNLARLRQRGLECPLRRVMDHAEPVWGTFVTGRSAAANGRWSSVAFDPSTYLTYQVEALRDEPFYALGDRAKVIVFDTPETVICDGVEGIQVTAWGAHAPHHTPASRPAGIYEEIVDRFGDHPANADQYRLRWHDAAFIDRITADYVTGLERRVAICRWLQQRLPDWDLFVTSTSELHSASELLWHGVDPDHLLAGAATAERARARLVDLYRATDDAVGAFAATVPDDTTLVVFSLHGLRSNDRDLASNVLLPELLHRLHFGTPMLVDPDQRRWRREGYPPVVPARAREWQVSKRTQTARPGRRLAEVVRRAVHGGRAGSSPRPAPTPRDGVNDELHWAVPTWYRAHWPVMKAFAIPTFQEAHVRVNLAGRERDGIVPPEGYAATLDELEATIRACRDPRTGRPAVADLTRPRAADPFDPDLPAADLSVLWVPGVDALEHPEVGTIGPFAWRRTGEHSDRAFALISGPGITAGRLPERPASDLPATILDLLGQEPPHALDGRSLLASV